MHSIGYSEGLYPAQWTALRFFAKAPDGSRTASSLARFQGFANGPVSRTVRTLISKGLLRKAEPQPAGRAEHLVITDNARSLPRSRSDRCDRQGDARPFRSRTGRARARLEGGDQDRFRRLAARRQGEPSTKTGCRTSGLLTGRSGDLAARLAQMPDAPLLDELRRRIPQEIAIQERFEALGPRQRQRRDLGIDAGS